MLSTTLFASLLLSAAYVVADPIDGVGTVTFDVVGQAYCEGLTPPQNSYAFTDGVNTFCGCTTATVSSPGNTLCPFDCTAIAEYTGTSTTPGFSNAACQSAAGQAANSCFAAEPFV
ncbi:primary-amine oxidase [Pseudohyphozyma bogoriensis]|nr:primary-amine oxidase [Pseudohyphozyma bogoriensis]